MQAVVPANRIAWQKMHMRLNPKDKEAEVALRVRGSAPFLLASSSARLQTTRSRQLLASRAKLRSLRCAESGGAPYINGQRFVHQEQDERSTNMDHSPCYTECNAPSHLHLKVIKLDTLLTLIPNLDRRPVVMGSQSYPNRLNGPEEPYSKRPNAT
jgi:hypothetical protein